MNASKHYITLPPTTCAAEFLRDVQLSGTRVPTWAL
jgi:hypothetical protein